MCPTKAFLAVRETGPFLYNHVSDKATCNSSSSIRSSGSSSNIVAPAVEDLVTAVVVAVGLVAEVAAVQGLVTAVRSSGIRRSSGSSSSSSGTNSRRSSDSTSSSSRSSSSSTRSTK